MASCGCIFIDRRDTGPNRSRPVLVKNTPASGRLGAQSGSRVWGSEPKLNKTRKWTQPHERRKAKGGVAVELRPEDDMLLLKGRKVNRPKWRASSRARDWIREWKRASGWFNCSCIFEQINRNVTSQKKSLNHWKIIEHSNCIRPQLLICWGWFCHLTLIGLTSSPYLMTGVPGKVMIRTRIALCSSHGTPPPTCEWFKHMWHCIQSIEDSQKLPFNSDWISISLLTKWAFNKAWLLMQ